MRVQLGFCQTCSETTIVSFLMTLIICTLKEIHLDETERYVYNAASDKDHDSLRIGLVIILTPKCHKIYVDEMLDVEADLSMLSRNFIGLSIWCLMLFMEKKLYELRHEKTGFLPILKQRCRSAVQLLHS